MKQIIIIRHGEKILSDPIHLSQDGRIRASGLVSYFSNHAREFRVPEIVYAMRPSSNDASHRCIETVKPFLKESGVPFCTDFDKIEIDLLVSQIQKDPRNTILVCWEHHMIPSIASLLGYPMDYWGFTPLKKETHDCFNATWVLESRTLKVFPQFDIIDSNIVYTRPRSVPLFEWKKPRLCCL